MIVNERNFFIHFPKCSRNDELQNHLAHWQKLRLKYGCGLPDDHLKLMFNNILPDHVINEIRQQRDLDTLQKQMNWVNSELSRYNDSRLSKWNRDKLVQQLRTGPKNAVSVSKVGKEEVAPEDQASAPPPPVPDMASMQANIERMVSAALTRSNQPSRGRPQERTPQGSRSGSQGSTGGGNRNRIPNPRFVGCWCCGSTEHTRQKCPVFLDIKAKNGGKIPKDYEGAYERSMKKTKTKVNAVSAHTELQAHDETFMWPLISAPIPGKVPTPQPTAVRNQYDSLSEDSDNDETEVMLALSQITSNIRLASDKNQSQRQKQQRIGKGIDMAKIYAVAQQVLNGELELPNLDLDNDEEYSCCWALVDTGAGVNCASEDHFPDGICVPAPEVRLTTADGKRMPNKGAMKVTTKSKEGIVTDRIFYKAPVEMPILSVAELSQEGSEGSSTLFRKLDGFIEDNVTQQRQHFVKRKGVYFMKLYTKRSKGNSTGFGRPGTP